MEILNVVVAAAAAWGFGAVWYMVLGQRWLEGHGIDEAEIDRQNVVPYAASFVLLILVAGMMRHVLATGGIDTAGAAILAGAGLGAFVAAPWVMMSVLYTGRGASLLWIDGLYPVVGCALIGLVLTLF